MGKKLDYVLGDVSLSVAVLSTALTAIALCELAFSAPYDDAWGQLVYSFTTPLSEGGQTDFIMLCVSNLLTCRSAAADLVSGYKARRSPHADEVSIRRVNALLRIALRSSSLGSMLSIAALLFAAAFSGVLVQGVAFLVGFLLLVLQLPYLKLLYTRTDMKMKRMLGIERDRSGRSRGADKEEDNGGQA